MTHVASGHGPHGKERKPQQPSLASAWATPRSVLTCTGYVCLVIPFCPWWRTTSETIEHFLLHCPRFHTHYTAPRSRFSTLANTTFDLPTLLAASGVHIHPSRQPTVLRLTYAFFRKTGQLPRL
ncbi:hypothetical protein E2C01_041049 [Portunus trituberculatus]|uniref:Uncharacterized protein n=1 Tax=Portunus trituberculatus TaxID=210409 RepID=A0A5B7FQU5_PORTR|nr:hypothetical protein [Portunus trituberculatus]